MGFMGVFWQRRCTFGTLVLKLQPQTHVRGSGKTYQTSGGARVSAMAFRCKVLMVEDNRDDEALALESLEGLGINDGIFIVRDGAEATDYLLGQGQYKDRGKF